ncbi:arginine--tRNA ligase [Candidatus Woesearchaeota archaeon]|nr:arginine--tRNA ligase [Candidatus Woesearchaeota archaeon]
MDYKEEITKILKKEIKAEVSLEIPPDNSIGDYAFPCFSLSKIYRKNPVEIANELRSKLEKEKISFIEKVEAKGPYVNFFINKKFLAEEAIKINQDFGRCSAKRKIMVEFSQANTHKAFHVGHIRATSFGESLARVLEFSGNDVIRANYQGDTGMHVAKWIWCYKKYHSKEKLSKEESWIASVYVDAVKRLAENESLQEEVNGVNKALEEEKDNELTALWKKTRDYSLEAFEKIYRELNTHFDRYYFEREVEKRGKEIAQELVKKGIAKISDGATIVDLEKYDLGIWVLLRSDGTVLYSAKDLALAEKKFKDAKISRSITVVGTAQSLHTFQILKTLELMKFPYVKDYRFVYFSEVRLPTGKMSSRTGENILYSDFKKEITDYAEKEIKKRFPGITAAETGKRALAISIAAVKYTMLKQDPNKNIVFDKEEALNFEGDTGPYLQYSYARASSILRKAKKAAKVKIEIPKIQEKEFGLVKALLEFPKQVERSAQQLDPSHIANYSFRLAQLFSEFYHACPVIGSEEEAFRLKLVEAFRVVIKQALYLLGIDVLERM